MLITYLLLDPGVWEIMDLESSDVVRFGLGLVILGKTSVTELKGAKTCLLVFL